MNLQDYVTEREARDPAFKAAGAELEPANQARRALIQARLAAGLTQQQLADRLGKPQSSIARLESGRHPPRLDTLTALADALGARFSIIPGRGLTFVSAKRDTSRVIGRRAARRRAPVARSS